MLNIVVNVAFASALVAAAPSDHQDKFVPSKLGGISSSGPAGLEGERPKQRVRALLEKVAESTPVEDVEVDTPQEKILSNVTIPASDTREKILSVFDPLEELGHLENSVVHEKNSAQRHPEVGEKIPSDFDPFKEISAGRNGFREVVYDKGFVLESEIPLYDIPEDSSLWQHQVEMKHNNIIDEQSESFGGYDNRAVVSDPTFDTEEVNQVEALAYEADEVKALAENTSSVNRSIARNLDAYYDCGGYYLPIYVDGSDFRNLVINCYNERDACPFPQPVSFNCWETSRVTNMQGTFIYSEFNQDISLWNTAKVTNMKEMFKESAFNQDISYWDVSSVSIMDFMFEGAYFFNTAIGTWDVSNVTSMWKMFEEASNFDQPIGTWDVSNVTSMWEMFEGAFFFNHPLDNWDVGKVIDMQQMFRNTFYFNQPLDNWDVGEVYFMFEMFASSNFNQCLSTWGQKVLDDVVNDAMFSYSYCPGTISPKPGNSPWCQRVEDGCFSESCENGFKPFYCNDFAALPQDALGLLCDLTNEFAITCPGLCSSTCETPSPNCKDKSKTFKIDLKGSLKTKDCDWLASLKNIDKQEKFCKKKVEVDGNNKKLLSICKKTCGEVGKGECSFLKDS